jgi:ketosteroid isomerase-like protein
MTARDHSDDETRIRQLIETRDRALLRKDPEAMLAPYTADVVCFDLAPPLRQTNDRADARKGLSAWFETWKSPIRIDRRELQIAVDVSLALAH